NNTRDRGGGNQGRNERAPGGERGADGEAGGQQQRRPTGRGDDGPRSEDRGDGRFRTRAGTEDGGTGKRRSGEATDRRAGGPARRPAPDA
ncbi:hypothetical protein C3R44_23375, partial [Mycobacterium tuberculosis]